GSRDARCSPKAKWRRKFSNATSVCRNRSARTSTSRTTSAASGCSHKGDQIMIELTLDMAERAAKAALAKAKQLGTVMTASIVDQSRPTLLLNHRRSAV